MHPTHYGRICPIETPEGPNIGLISSLSCFARINEYGFIESPYRRVKDGHVVDEVQILNPGDTDLKVGQVLLRHELDKAVKAAGGKKGTLEYEAHCDYLSAWEEDKYIVAQANVAMDEKGNITAELVNARQAGNFVLKHVGEIEYMDVSPKQLVSVAASLIPFLENDDANRALMGSNMQRQAVPLLRADSPYVGTGMERVTARDSGAVVLCKRSGVVDSVDSERIIVRVEGNTQEGQLSREVGADIYTMTKFKRSNQNTCINQKPIVMQGMKVKKGDVLADGPCTELGELALGRNVLVAFMPWRGYNFEDAIVVSEKLVKEDYYTSIHIEEFEVDARDTKLGPEEITRDIPNIAEGFLRNLDESGIIRIGATVKPGDILVGKVTPKGETQLTPEEKLLRAIFGEKAGDVKDASLYCPPGIEGTVVDCKVFSRKGAELDERSKLILENQEERLRRNLEDEKRILNDERSKRLSNMLDGKQLLADLHDEKTNKKLLAKGTDLTRDMIEKLRARDLKRMKLKDKDPRLNEQVDEIEEMTSRQIAVLEKITDEKIAKLRKGDELPPGVIKQVKCYIAMKRKLSVGDKMAGRHGNKGVIARIVPEEDMPYLPGRNAGRNRSESSGRSFPYERRADSGNALGLGGARVGRQIRNAGIRRRHRKRHQGAAQDGEPAELRQSPAGRRHQRPDVRTAGDGGLHLYVEAVAPGGRQDPRTVDRAVFVDHAAAAGRQSPVRRTALRRNGSLGSRSIWSRLRSAGTVDRQIRRRLRSRQDLRSDREGRSGGRAGRAGKLQRSDSRVAVAVSGRRVDEEAGRRSRYCSGSRLIRRHHVPFFSV